jgi:hypothetical protein
MDGAKQTESHWSIAICGYKSRRYWRSVGIAVFTMFLAPHYLKENVWIEETNYGTCYVTDVWQDSGACYFYVISPTFF